MGTTQQGVPQGSEQLAEREWIDLLDPLAEGSLPILRPNSRGQQALQRPLGDVIHPPHLLVLGPFGLELRGGLKVIDHEAQRAVDLPELLLRLHSRQPHAAYGLAHHGSVLLLHMALIVFDPWAPARKSPVFLFTIREQLRIEELSAASAVDAQQRKREGRAGLKGT